MRAPSTLRTLFRHRVTSWLRDPSWGTGTVAGQVVLLGGSLLTGAWGSIGGVGGGLGLAGLLGIAWTRAPLAHKLDRHRREMVEAFREKEPI